MFVYQALLPLLALVSEKSAPPCSAWRDWYSKAIQECDDGMSDLDRCQNQLNARPDVHCQYLDGSEFESEYWSGIELDPQSRIGIIRSTTLMPAALAGRVTDTACLQLAKEGQTNQQCSVFLKKHSALFKFAAPLEHLGVRGWTNAMRAIRQTQDEIPESECGEFERRCEPQTQALSVGLQHRAAMKNTLASDPSLDEGTGTSTSMVEQHSAEIEAEETLAECRSAAEACHKRRPLLSAIGRLRWPEGRCDLRYRPPAGDRTAEEAYYQRLDACNPSNCYELVRRADLLGTYGGRDRQEDIYGRLLSATRAIETHREGCGEIPTSTVAGLYEQLTIATAQYVGAPAAMSVYRRWIGVAKEYLGDAIRWEAELWLRLGAWRKALRALDAYDSVQPPGTVSPTDRKWSTAIRKGIAALNKSDSPPVEPGMMPRSASDCQIPENQLRLKVQAKSALKPLLTYVKSGTVSECVKSYLDAICSAIASGSNPDRGREEIAEYLESRYFLDGRDRASSCRGLALLNSDPDKVWRLLSGDVTKEKLGRAGVDTLLVYFSTPSRTGLNGEELRVLRYTHGKPEIFILGDKRRTEYALKGLVFRLRRRSDSYLDFAQRAYDVLLRQALDGIPSTDAVGR